MADRIKIGQLGIGHNHASEKMNTLRRFPELFEVVGVAEEDPTWREKRSGLDAYRELRWMSETELLSVPGLQAVAVETDGHELVPAALRCIEAGKHIHLDKPGGEALEPFQRLLGLAGEKNLTVQMGYMYRYNAAVRFAQEILHQGLPGEIFEIDAVMSRCGGEEYRQWLGGFQGGAMYIFACHLIDLIVSMLGKPERIIGFPKCTRRDGVVDNGLAVLEYPGGCTVTVRTTVVEIEGFQRRNLILCGSKGTLEIMPLEPPRARLALLEAHGGWEKGYQEVPLPPPEGRYDAHMKEFAEIVRGEKKNPYSLEYELLVQRCHLEACGYKLE